MTKRDKIIACIGHIKSSSIYKLCGTSNGYALNVVTEYLAAKKDEYEF